MFDAICVATIYTDQAFILFEVFLRLNHSMFLFIHAD